MLSQQIFTLYLCLEVSVLLGYRSTEQRSFLSSSSHLRNGQAIDCMVDLVGIAMFHLKKEMYVAAF